MARRSAGTPRHTRRRSVAAWVLGVQTIVLLTGAAVVFGLLAWDATTSAHDDAGTRSRDLVLALAGEPSVIDAVSTAHERITTDRESAVATASAALQPYAAQLMAATGVDYITIMDTDRTRYTHAIPSRIGGAFLGTIEPSLAGETITEVYEGTLGSSVRAVTPVRDGDEIVGMVSAGITLGNISGSILERLALVGLCTAGILAAGTLATVLVFRRLDRVTGGRDPEELARLFAAHEAVLHSLEEGLVLIEHPRPRDGTPSPRPRVALANDQAGVLLGVPLRAPLDLDDPALPAPVRDVLSGRNADAVTRVGGKDLIVGRIDTESAGRAVQILTLRDRTELRRVTGELSSVRTISAALRAQTHEFDNRLHTIASLIELGHAEEALRFAASERDIGQRLADRVLHAVDEPVIAALMLGKAAQARERAVELTYETHLDPGTHGLPPEDVVTILGNLIDNAMDAAAAHRTPETEPWVEVYLGEADDASLAIQVSDSGEGITPEDRERVFERGYTTKIADARGRGYGLGIVRQVVQSLGGTIEVGETAGGGAVFTVTVPLPSDAGEDDAAQRDERHATPEAQR